MHYLLRRSQSIRSIPPYIFISCLFVLGYVEFAYLLNPWINNRLLFYLYKLIPIFILIKKKLTYTSEKDLQIIIFIVSDFDIKGFHKYGK